IKYSKFSFRARALSPKRPKPTICPGSLQIPPRSPGNNPPISHPAHPARTFSQGQHPPTVLGKTRVRKPPSRSREPARRPDRTVTAVTEARCNKLIAAMATTGNRKQRDRVTGAERDNLATRSKGQDGHVE
uniref:Uncharacterized protein n=1 Tax=Marmota marmota marmota TaxID=9994 RepID=A0A8C5YVB0_MARMA